MTTPTWEPGDPLHERRDNGGSQYRMALYSFRDDSTAEDCSCSDAAHWPEPGSRSLGPRDDLIEFIAAHRRAQETA